MDTRRDAGEFYPGGKVVATRPVATGGDVKHSDFADLDVKTNTLPDLRAAVKGLAARLGATVVTALAVCVATAATVQTVPVNDLDLDANPSVVTNVVFDAPPDFSTNNTELVTTIEAKAPAPGDYAAVSNAAMNALSRNGGTVTLSNGIFAVGWDDDWHGTGFVPCIAVDMTGVDPIITIGDDYAGHGGAGETYFRNPVRFRDYASVDFEHGFTTYGDRGDHEVYVNGQPQYVDYALVTDITPAISNAVPAWALAATKPTYTASEVGALSLAGGTLLGNLTVESTGEKSEIRAEHGNEYISLQVKDNKATIETSDYTYTMPNSDGTVALTKNIPNVPAWALAAQKPTYTAAEVGAYSTNETMYVDWIGDIGYIYGDYMPSGVWDFGDGCIRIASQYQFDLHMSDSRQADGIEIFDIADPTIKTVIPINGSDVATIADIPDVPASVSNIVSTAYVREKLGVWMEYDEATGFYYYCHEEE